MKVLIIEDHELSRMKMVNLLDAMRDVEIVGQIASLAAGASVIKQKKPDVVILDLKFLVGFGLEEFSSMMSRYPPARAIFFADSDVGNWALP